MVTITEQENNKQKQLTTAFEFLDVMDANGKPFRLTKEGLAIAIKPLVDGGQEFRVVQSLPPMGINGYIYLVKSSSGTNVYDQHVWDNEKWVNIGKTTIDMENVNRCLAENKEINRKIGILETGLTKIMEA